MQSLTESKFPDALPEFRDAWNLQLYIESLKESVAEQEAKLQGILSNLRGSQDKVFAVVGMKERRSIDAKVLRETRPDLFEKYGKLSDKSIGLIFKSYMDYDQVVKKCRELSDGLTNDCMTVSVSELQKAIGKRGIDQLPEGCVKTVAYASSAHLEIRPEYAAKLLPSIDRYPTHDTEGMDDE